MNTGSIFYQTNVNLHDYLNDPFTKIKHRGARKADWNEYQRIAKLNAFEFSNPPDLSDKENLIRLSSIKKALYNPALPTLRKIDRDDVLCKLADEHSRHTTTQNSFSLNPSYFNETDSVFKSASSYFEPAESESSVDFNLPRIKSAVPVNYEAMQRNFESREREFANRLKKFDDTKSIYRAYKKRVNEFINY